MEPRETCIWAVFTPLLIAQYAMLFHAASTTYVDMPECRATFNGYKNAHMGWERGACLTEEQVWCRAHPGKHPDCKTADCRAEEIRFALPRHNTPAPSSEPVYQGCPAADTLRIRLLASNYTVCVPNGDKRSLFLPACSAEDAARRGIFFRLRNLVSVRTPPPELR